MTRARLGEDVEEIDDLRHYLAVFAGDFFLLEPGQALQPKLEYRLRLRFREPVTLSGSALPAVLGCQPLRPGGVGRRPREHLLDERRAPRPRHQRRLGLGGRRRRLDQRDDLVDVRQRNGQPLENVPAFARLAELEPRAPHDDLAPVLQEEFEELLEIEQPRLAIDQRDHVHAEAVLQLRQFV